jgi:hypothetical protein
MSAIPSSHLPSSPSPAERRLLTAGDLAQRWQVPASQVYHLTRLGALPVVRLGRYRVDAIEAWELAGGVTDA